MILEVFDYGAIASFPSVASGGSVGWGFIQKFPTAEKLSWAENLMGHNW